MYASENFLSNVVLFPEKSEPTLERLAYYCRLTKISRKYLSKIEQEFEAIADLFSLRFSKEGERGYETLSIFSGEIPVIYYQVCSETIIGSTNLKELNFLYQTAMVKAPVF